MFFSIKIIILYFILIYVNIINATTTAIIMKNNMISLFNNLTDDNTEKMIFISAVNLYEKYHQHQQQQIKFQHNIQKKQEDEIFRKRSKRFVIFNGSGIIKLVLAYSQPLNFGLKKPFQQLNTIYNFQFQFQVPTRPIYPWNITTWAMRKLTNKSLYYDRSRIFIYQIIESFLSHRGLNGRQCLLKTLCDVAHDPIYGLSLFHNILRIILSPTVNNIDSIYWNAKEAGEFKFNNCSKLYPQCNESENWLKKLSQYYYH